MTKPNGFDLYEATLYRESLLRRIKYPRVKDPRAIRRAVDKGGKLRPAAYYNKLEKAIAIAAAEKREEEKRRASA